MQLQYEEKTITLQHLKIKERMEWQNQKKNNRFRLNVPTVSKHANLILTKQQNGMSVLSATNRWMFR